MVCGPAVGRLRVPVLQGLLGAGVGSGSAGRGQGSLRHHCSQGSGKRQAAVIREASENAEIVRPPHSLRNRKQESLPLVSSPKRSGQRRRQEVACVSAYTQANNGCDSRNRT